MLGASYQEVQVPSHLTLGDWRSRQSGSQGVRARRWVKRLRTGGRRVEAPTRNTGERAVEATVWFCSVPQLIIWRVPLP